MKEACRATRLGFLALGIAVASRVPIAPFIKSRLNLDDIQFGWSLFVYGTGTFLAMPLASWLVKRFGSRLVVVIAAILLVGLLPAMVIAPTLFYLGIVLFLFAAAGSALNIAINTQAIILESQSGRSLMSGFHCLFSMGSLLGVMLVGLLLEFHLSLVFCALLISAVIAAIIASQWKNFLPDHPVAEPSSETGGRIERRVVILGLLCFVAFMSEGAILNWSAIFLSSSLDYSIARSGIGYAFFSIAMTGGRLLGDRIISRYGQFVTFQTSCLISTLGFITLATTLWPYAELMGFILVGIGASNIVPILFSSSGKNSKMAPSYTLTIVTFFGYAGGLAGPVFIGFVSNAFSLALAFACMAAVLFVIGLFGPSLVLRPSSEPAR